MIMSRPVMQAGGTSCGQLANNDRASQLSLSSCTPIACKVFWLHAALHIYTCSGAVLGMGRWQLGVA